MIKWVFRIFLAWTYYKFCCYEHLHTCALVSRVHISVVYTLKPNPVESREAPPTSSFPDFSEPPWEATWGHLHKSREPRVFHSPLSLSLRLFSSSSLSAIRVVSSAYLRLLIFLLAILIPAYASSSPAFLMMYPAYKLNKQDDNMQPWRTPFPIWKPVCSMSMSSTLLGNVILLS